MFVLCFFAFTTLLMLSCSWFNEFTSLSFSPTRPLQAEARLAAKRAARAEAREIRMRELERQQKEVKKQQFQLTTSCAYGGYVPFDWCNNHHVRTV